MPRPLDRRLSENDHLHQTSASPHLPASTSHIASTFVRLVQHPLPSTIHTTLIHTASSLRLLPKKEPQQRARRLTRCSNYDASDTQARHAHVQTTLTKSFLIKLGVVGSERETGKTCSDRQRIKETFKRAICVVLKHDRWEQ